MQRTIRLVHMMNCYSTKYNDEIERQPGLGELTNNIFVLHKIGKSVNFMKDATEII